MKPASPVYAHTHNALLALLEAEVPVGERIPVQQALAARCGASRTTVHHVLRALGRTGLLGEKKGGGLHLLRPPRKKEYLPQPRALSRRDEVEEGIMRRILDGRLRPGERFSELALARDHGVTTGTIREALLRLARLGIFTKAARKQWQVARIDAAMIQELMDLRVLLETFALEGYFLRDDRAPAPFVALLAATRELARGKTVDYDAFFQLDRDLHRAILEAGRNRYLAESFQFVSFPIQVQFLQRRFRQDRIRRGLRQHIGLLEAIVADDARAAEKLLREHLQAARETLLRF